MPNLGEQRVITEVQRLREKGQSLRQVSATLTARGIVNRDGKPFHPMTLARMKL